MNKYLLSCLLLLLCFGAQGQNQLASPQIVNYISDDYKAGIQNWDVAQDQWGRLYFGNNEGLLTFNGHFWNLYRLPNFTVVRSVEIDSKNRIYIGGQDEIGYFLPDERGELKYHSLVSLIPESERSFSDIWNISIINDEVFFRAINKIIHYKEGSIKIYRTDTEWVFLGQAHNQLFAQAKQVGVLKYSNGIWRPFCNSPLLNGAAITSITEYGGDTLLVSTLKNGLFYLINDQLISKKTSLDKTFYNDRIYCCKQVNTQWFAIGTTSAGVIIIDRQGRLVQKYAFQDGLQNNNCRGLLIDQHKNLWLPLDDGIDFIALNSSIKSIHPDKSRQTTSYAMNVFNNRLFIGSSTGLYACQLETGQNDLSLSKSVLFEVNNTKGQVWNLDEVNNHLLMGHEDGFFEISGTTAKQIYSTPGTWLVQPVSNVFPSQSIIAGTYKGLQHIKYSNGTFSDLKHIDGLYESLRFIAFDNTSNTIWASHPYKGVFRLELSGDFSKIIKRTIYTKKNGLPSDLGNYIYRIKNRIVVASEKGIYEFVAVKNRFVLSTVLNDALSGYTVRYLKEDPDGNVWFVSDKDIGVVDFQHPSKGKPYTLFYFQELKDKVVKGFECIYPFNSENIFVGASKVVYHLNYKKYLQNISKPTVVLGKVRLLGEEDSVLFGGYNASSKQGAINKLAHKYNSVRFEYSSTLFEQLKNTEFSYQLVGFDKDWSQWTDKFEKDYTNLPAGKYSFKVKARNNQGADSVPVFYTFIVLPPWYQTWWMYCLYVALFLGSMYFIYRWQQKKHKEEQQKMQYLHQLELDRNEKEIVRLEKENLEADINYKNKELSIMTMHLVERGKVLAKVKEMLVKKPEANEKSTSFRQLLRLIRDVENGEQDWNQFTMHFNNVNDHFFNKLKTAYPDLTSTELKLCAYIKMNLSTKEIAQLMNITSKAIEVARYRLRKKLRLTPETNLYDFLTKVSKE
ncbi:transcriptional regulator [Solitalea sp. MAHUQ-68]|uniref:Transcriptional regulator n=1 Tax=Solitalea agri TaxID=2953739 RepID=A0A9X2F5I5_9SPHI|nr:triple tyrosine motif-containing protein [Solitalea agri]MCO4294630.1 transcriptional regulator [Solitalea agri]